MITVTARELKAAQSIITAAHRALSVPIALRAGNSAIVTARGALGALAKTFGGGELLELIPEADTMRINWATGHMILKDTKEPTEQAATVDLDEVLKLADEDGTAKALAAKLLGEDVVQDVQQQKTLEKIDKTWLECTKRAENIATWAEGRTPKRRRYADNSQARAAEILKDAIRLQKAMKTYSKLGGDFASEVRALLEKAEREKVEAEKAIPDNISELEATQEKYTEIYNDMRGVPYDVMRAHTEAQEARAVWLSSDLKRGDDLFKDYQSKIKQATAAFIAWCGVDPDYTRHGEPLSSAMVSVELKAARDALAHLKAVEDRREAVSKLVFAVDHLEKALTMPATIIRGIK